MRARIILGGIGIFILFLILGTIFRMVWFYFVQKEILEYTYIEKPLREAKGGGKTPEETWIGYLNALEKGNIEEAVQYIWPENRENVKKYLLLLKENGKLPLFVSTYDKNIKKVEHPTRMLENDEVMYSYISTAYKELDYFNASEKDKEFLDEWWVDKKSNIATYTQEVIFKYNPYTKRWLIK